MLTKAEVQKIELTHWAEETRKALQKLKMIAIKEEATRTFKAEFGLSPIQCIELIEQALKMLFQGYRIDFDAMTTLEKGK